MRVVALMHVLMALACQEREVEGREVEGTRTLQPDAMLSTYSVPNLGGVANARKAFALFLHSFNAPSRSRAERVRAQGCNVAFRLGSHPHRIFRLRGGDSSHGTCVGLGPDAKAALVGRLLAAKEASGKTFDEISKELGLTNGYTAQLFYNQAQLKPATAEKLKKVVPRISAEDLETMQRCPKRSFDPAVLQEPLVYRFYEAIMHYAEATKALINEQCGDGIMSAIDFYYDVGTTTGVNGEKRVVLTMNGKFLPHIEQAESDNTAPGPRS